MANLCSLLLVLSLPRSLQEHHLSRGRYHTNDPTPQQHSLSKPNCRRHTPSPFQPLPQRTTRNCSQQNSTPKSPSRLHFGCWIHLFRTLTSLLVLALVSIAPQQVLAFEDNRSLVRRSANRTSPWSTSPFPFPAIPLAVKSPYLNAWAPQGNNPSQSGAQWPVLGVQSTPSNLGWVAHVRVDGTTYGILGDGVGNGQATKRGNQTAVDVTSTTTTFQFVCGGVNVSLALLSSVEPTDLLRQSMLFSYMYINVVPADGQPHDVQVYSDISAEWISGDDNLEARGDTQIDNEMIALSTQLSNPTPFAEIGDHSQDSIALYSMLQTPGANLTWQTGGDGPLRHQFNSTGQLSNTSDPNPRVIAVPGAFPVFGISADLGTISQPGPELVWSLGLWRDPVIQYATGGATPQMRSSYVISQFPNTSAAAAFHLNDFSRAKSSASSFDSKIQDAGLKYAQNYADLLTLSTRQVWSAVDITISGNSNGWNLTDVKAFMKNLGDDASNSSVNSVDTLYSSFPMFLYLNPDVCKYLLAPLLEYQESGGYAHPFAATDLGPGYPNATGNNLSHNLGIQTSGSMLIMTLAHAQASGDVSLILKHYNLLRSWAEYLVAYALAPGGQKTNDNLSSSNQTNLALKGIIGIGAMAKMSEYVGQEEDFQRYQSTSVSYAEQWQSLTLSLENGHLLGAYGQPQSSGMIYNLFADTLLRTNLIPTLNFDTQASWYNSQSVNPSLGLPVDSTTPHTARTDWMLFSAAAISNSTIQNELVSQVWSYAATGAFSLPFPVTYDTSQGTTDGKPGNPAQGAMFALLALSQPTKAITVGGPSANSNRSKVAIIAGVTIGVVGIVLLTTVLVFWARRRRNKGKDIIHVSEIDTHIPFLGVQYGATPFSLPSSPTTTNVDPPQIPEPAQPHDTWRPSEKSSHVVVLNYAPAGRSIGQPNSENENGFSATGSASQIELNIPTHPNNRWIRVQQSSTSGGPHDDNNYQGSNEGSADRSHSSSTDTNVSVGRSNITAAALLPASQVPDADQVPGTYDLRNEVEYLRQEVLRIRNGRNPTFETQEAPPEYTSSQTHGSS